MGQEDKTKGSDDQQVQRLVSAEQLIAGHKQDGRAVYRRQAKARLVAAAIAPGASVAKLARDHGLNANQLHAWIRAAKQRNAKLGRLAVKVGAAMEQAALKRTQAKQQPEGVQANLVPVVLGAPAGAQAAPSTAITIELGAARIVVSGPIDRSALAVVLDCLHNRAVYNPGH